MLRQNIDDDDDDDDDISEMPQSNLLNRKGLEMPFFF